jgi:ATP-dependent DNA ligase
MTNRQPIPTDALLVAIDIAKVRNEVLIEAPNHKRRRRLSVLNTRAEHDRLIETLRASLWQTGDLRLRDDWQLSPSHRVAPD